MIQRNDGKDRFSPEQTQKIRELTQKGMEATLMDYSILSNHWKQSAHHALKLTPILQIGVQTEAYKQLIDFQKSERLTLYEFAILSNNLQAKTPDELGLTLHGYADLMLEADGYVRVWQVPSNEIEAVAIDVVRKEAEAERSKMLGGQGAGLRSIKAEA